METCGEGGNFDWGTHTVSVCVCVCGEICADKIYKRITRARVVFVICCEVSGRRTAKWGR